MDEKKRKLLKRKASEVGCKTVDEFMLQCEFNQIIGKLQRSFDRAVILPAPPEPWDVYLSMQEQYIRGNKK